MTDEADLGGLRNGHAWHTYASGVNLGTERAETAAICSCGWHSSDINLTVEQAAQEARDHIPQEQS